MNGPRVRIERRGLPCMSAIFTGTSARYSLPSAECRANSSEEERPYWATHGSRIFRLSASHSSLRNGYWFNVTTPQP